MPHQKKQPNIEEWKPDPNKALSIPALKEGRIVIGGQEVSSDVYEIIRTEGQAFMSGFLPDLLANMVLNEAARYALEEAKPNESAEMRSSKLAFAQGLATWNVHFMNAMKIISKM